MPKVIFPMGGGGGGGAPADAPYLTDGAAAGLTNERNIQALTAELVWNRSAPIGDVNEGINLFDATTTATGAFVPRSISTSLTVNPGAASLAAPQALQGNWATPAGLAFDVDGQVGNDVAAGVSGYAKADFNPANGIANLFGVIGQTEVVDGTFGNTMGGVVGRILVTAGTMTTILGAIGAVRALGGTTSLLLGSVGLLDCPAPGPVVTGFVAGLAATGSFFGTAPILAGALVTDFTTTPGNVVDQRGVWIQNQTGGVTNWNLYVDTGGNSTLGSFASVGANVGPFAAEQFRVVGDAYISGKLTVVGVIDPTAVILSDPAAGTALYVESFPGQTAPVSGATTGRQRYNDTTGRWQVSTQGGPYSDLITAATLPTLAWVQGGNAFGALGVFGTTDAFDVSLRRAGAEKLRLVAGGATVTGSFNPATDSTVNLGTSALRFTTIVGNAHQVFALLADPNPTAVLDSSRLRLGLNTADALSWSLSTLVATNRADMGPGDALGANDPGGAFVVRALAADANPVVVIGSGIGNGTISMGVNSADALSVKFSVPVTGRLEFTAGNVIDTLGAGAFENRALSADANPRMILSSDAIAFGAGGASPVDVKFGRPPGTPDRLEGSLGDSLGLLGAGLFYNRALSADVNPRMLVSSDSIAFGAGGASVVDVKWGRPPGIPDRFQGDLGDFCGTTGIGAFYNRLASADVNPRMLLDSGSLLFGVGGASPPDLRLTRSTVSEFTLDNNAAGGANLIPPGDNLGNLGLTTGPRRWAGVATTRLFINGRLTLQKALTLAASASIGVDDTYTRITVAAVVATLPTVAALTAGGAPADGAVFFVKRVPGGGAGAGVVAAPVGTTIDGAATVTLAAGGGGAASFFRFNAPTATWEQN